MRSSCAECANTAGASLLSAPFPGGAHLGGEKSAGIKGAQGPMRAEKGFPLLKRSPLSPAPVSAGATFRLRREVP
jgi:hypothetical protein